MVPVPSVALVHRPDGRHTSPIETVMTALD